MKTQPVHEVRIGAVKAAVWKNEAETGVRHTVTFRRLYKDANQWQASDSFGRCDDPLLLAKVPDQTHSWVCAQQQQDQGVVPRRSPRNRGNVQSQLLPPP